MNVLNLADDFKHSARPTAGYSYKAVSSRQRTNLEVPEGDGELLVLKPQVSFRKPRVTNIERGLAVQFDDEMIAVRRDLKAIPVIRLECVSRAVFAVPTMAPVL